MGVRHGGRTSGCPPLVGLLSRDPGPCFGRVAPASKKLRVSLAIDDVRVGPRTQFPPKPIFIFIDRGTLRGRKQRSTKIKLKKYRPAPAPDFGATPRGPPCFDCVPCLHCLACIPSLAPLRRADGERSGVSTGKARAYRVGRLEGKHNKNKNKKISPPPRTQTVFAPQPEHHQLQGSP